MHRDLLIEAAFDVAKEDKTFRLTLGQQLVFVPAIKVKPVVRIDSKFGIASENAFDLKFFTDSKTLAEIAILEFASLPRGICLSTSKRRVFLDESYVTSWVVTISSDKGVFDIEGSRVTPPSYAVISVPDGRSWSAPIVISW